MQRSREVLILIAVGIVLSIVARVTAVQDLLLVVLFVIAVAVVHFALGDGRADD